MILSYVNLDAVMVERMKEFEGWRGMLTTEE